MSDQPTSEPSDLAEQLLEAITKAFGYSKLYPEIKRRVIEAISTSGLADLEARLAAKEGLLVIADRQLGAALRERDEARAVLHDIAGGHTSQYVDAPDPMTAESPAAFQHDMWTWSQKIARLATEKGE